MAFIICNLLMCTYIGYSGQVWRVNSLFKLLETQTSLFFEICKYFVIWSLICKNLKMTQVCLSRVTLFMLMLATGNHTFLKAGGHV